MLAEYKKINLEIFNSLFKFSAIRTPWERLVSLYFKKYVSHKPLERQNFIDLIFASPNLGGFIITPTSEIDFLLRFLFGGTNLKHNPSEGITLR